MKQKIIFLSLFLNSVFLHVLGQPGLDTVDTQSGKLILHSDQTWSIVNDANFDGVLNPRIHKIVNSYSPAFKQSWNNNVCFTSKGNDLTHLKDTIWLCLNEAREDANDFHFPLKRIQVNSHYGPRGGRYHNGTDLDLDVGDTVYATFSGKIRYAKYNEGGFGNLVVVRHYNGLETFYAHLSKFLVAPNQNVQCGDPIALGGNTGRSTGPHLHFEVRFYDACINPEEIIDFGNKKLRKENLFLHKALFRPGAQPTEFIEVLPSDQIAAQTANLNPSTATMVATPIPKPAIPKAQKKYYQIKAGDTLTRIAAIHHTTVSSVCDLNNISPSTTLKIGRSLRIK